MLIGVGQHEQGLEQARAEIERRRSELPDQQPQHEQLAAQGQYERGGPSVTVARDGRGSRADDRGKLRYPQRQADAVGREPGRLGHAFDIGPDTENAGEEQEAGDQPGPDQRGVIRGVAAGAAGRDSLRPMRRKHRQG